MKSPFKDCLGDKMSAHKMRKILNATPLLATNVCFNLSKMGKYMLLKSKNNIKY